MDRPSHLRRSSSAVFSLDSKKYIDSNQTNPPHMDESPPPLPNSSDNEKGIFDTNSQYDSTYGGPGPLAPADRYERGVVPYQPEQLQVSSREVGPTPNESPRDSIELEKQDTEKGHGHGGGQGPDLTAMISGIRPPLPFFERLQHFTWAWFTLTMSTGGFAVLLSIQPHEFPGLLTIGAVFYVFNIVLFTAICSLLLLRFTKYPGSFKESLMHEREGLFFGPFWLSVATIITGTQNYVLNSIEDGSGSEEWLTITMAVAFWAYTLCTFLTAVIQYSYLFASLKYEVMKFMPSWLLPIFPVMLAGTIASVIADSQPPAARMPILVAGLGCQGLGFTVAILMYAHYIGRLMQAGLPGREHRAAMYIGVGPPSFTALAFIGMANALPDQIDINGDMMMDAGTARTMAIIAAIFLWILAFWFFSIATVAVVCQPPKLFHLGLWAIVFPDTGFTIATINIGKTLQSEGIMYLGNGMTIFIALAWLTVFYFNFRAVFVRDIMYPHMDEDVADH